MINFAKNKRVFILPWICTETSNLQVKFHASSAFHKCYPQHYLFCVISLIRVTYAKFWWNKIASLTTCNFVISKNPLTIFLINVRISIWNFLFYKKTVREKVIVFKISKASYFLLVGRADIVLFWDI